MGCSLANLGECLPESFMQFLLDLFNGPRQPLLTLVQRLFTEPVDISSFKSLWVVIVTVLGMFYALAFLYAGINFIIAGFDASRKDTAKRWLRDTILMAVSINASYWLYQLIVEMGALLTVGVFSLIPPDFFKLTADSVGELGLSLMLSFAYTSVLQITVLLLTLRYVLVAAGVLFFPIGLFFYFLPPLRSLGRLMLWLCGSFVFMTFLASIGLLMASKMVALDVFNGWKVVLMISAFFIVNLTLVGMLLFSLIKGAMSMMDLNLYQTIKTSAKMIL